MSFKYTVKNADGDTRTVSEDKIHLAEKDGYRPVVINGAGDERTASYANLERASKDGYRPMRSSSVGTIESTLRGAAQGLSFGFADEITGGLESLLTDKTYEQARDESRKAYKESAEANPVAYNVGDIGGMVATSFVPGMNLLNAGKGAGLGVSIAKGAAQGGIQGAGRSESEDGDGMVKDAGIGAAFGGAGGAAGYGLSKAIEKLPSVDVVKNKLQSKAREKAFESLSPTLAQQMKAEAGMAGVSIDDIGREMLESGVLKRKNGLPASIDGIKLNLEKRTDDLGRQIGAQLEEAQYAIPGFEDYTIPSTEIASIIKEKVQPFKQTPFWRGAQAVEKEADMIASWNREFTLPELNTFKSELGKRIKDWGTENLSDKRIYQEMYDAINEKIEKDFAERMGGSRALRPDFENLPLNTKLDAYEKPLGDFKATKKSYGALENAEKIATRAAARASANNDIGLTSYIAGGIGGFTAGGIPGAVAGIGVREVGRRYYNQTAALLLNKLSKSNLSKFAGPLKKAAEQGPQQFAVTLYVLAKNNPDLNEFLNQNPNEDQ